MAGPRAEIYAEWIDWLCRDDPPASAEHHGATRPASYMRPPTRLEEVADDLGGLGRAARVARSTAAALVRMDEPVILSIDGGTIALLVARRRRTLELATLDGACHRVPEAELARRFDGWIVEAVDPLLGAGRRLRRRLLQRLFVERRAVAAIFGLMAAGAALGLAVPFGVGVLIDRAMPDEASALVVLVAISIALVAVQRALLAAVRELATSRLVARCEHVVSSTVLSEMLALGYDRLRRHQPARLLETHRHAVAGTRVFVDNALGATLTGVSALGQLAMLWVVSPAIAPVAAMIVAVTAVIAFVFAGVLSRIGLLQVEAVAVEQGVLADILGDPETVIGTGSERAAFARWSQALVTDRLTRHRSEQTRARRDAALEAIRILVTVVVLVATAGLVGRGELTIGGMLMTTTVFGALLTGLVDLARRITVLGSMPEYFAAVDALSSGPPPAKRGRSSPPMRGAPAVVMRDVWFRYAPDGPWVVAGFSCTIPAGARIRFDGVSGSGKSTLLRIIAGQLRPERGDVEVFGRSPDPTRGNVCHLAQGATLLDASIAENLMLLSGEADATRIADAARQTGLAQWLEELPMRAATLVGARGCNLSGGQRQLVLLTAALASDRPLLLLDESASHLDALTAARSNHAGLYAGRTVITVDHAVASRAADPSSIVRVGTP
jgi:ABC-type bacteriocin/lantibiotic exporter with double-glycine peptidase domain